ncbi:hypothetical protein Tco_1124535, partial [Tanacetum coccineum]
MAVNLHFQKASRRTSKAKKAKVDGTFGSVLYWCSYGPDDYREGGYVRPSRRKKKSAARPSTKRSVSRPSIKRGCTCRFIVKHLRAKPSAALIKYNHDKHVDSKGLPCHGPQDEHSVGTRAMYAPSISEEFRQRVISLLHVGISVETIMHRHNESVEIQGGPSNIDDLITKRHVKTLKKKLDGQFSDMGPFLLGIQTEWQLQQMIRFGNGRLVTLDSRFGTNKLKDPTWKLAGFIVDDPLTDVLTIRIGSWITALKTMPIASLESSIALELYHSQLKIRFLNNETDFDIYKRADWLVNKLSTKLHSYFWLDEYEGKDGFSRYWKDEWATDFNSW